MTDKEKTELKEKIEAIKLTIASGDTRKSLDAIKSLNDEKKLAHSSEITLLLNQLNEQIKKKNLNLIDSKEYDLNVSKITFSTLELLSKIENDFFLEGEKESEINNIINQLGEKKHIFLEKIRRKIIEHVNRKTPSDCLTFVTRRSDDNKVSSIYEPEASLTYAEVLIAFCREKSYSGKVLDSYLTDGIIDVVTKEFETFYSDNSDQIAEGISKIVIADKVLMTSMASTMINSFSGTIPDYLRTKVSTLLALKMQEIMKQKAANTITHTVSKSSSHLVATTVSSPIAMKIGLIVVKFIMLNIKVITAKFLASAAFKAAIAGLVKKFVLAAIVGVIVKTIAAKFGISVGAAFAWVLIPLIAAYLYYEATHLPEHLGDKVSEKIVEKLSGDFKEMNKSIVNQIYMGLSVMPVPAMGENMKDNQILDLIEQFLDELNKNL